MKTYVIGDTHGCYFEFEKLMKKINLNCEEDKLVMLGDFIDRGDQSWELVNEIKAMQEKYGTDYVVLLRGNHEQMAIDYVLHNDINWLRNGAHNTLESFKRNNDSIENYIHFFMGFPLYHEDENFICPWRNQAWG